MASTVVPTGRFAFLGEPAPGVPLEAFSFRATGRILPTTSGAHALRIVQSGRARVLLDGAVVLDATEGEYARGDEFFGLASEEIGAVVELEAGRAAELEIEYSNRDSALLNWFRIGLVSLVEEDLLGEAEALAEAGVLEINLVSQATVSYGRALGGARHALDYHVVGSDGSGVVLPLGSAVRNWKPGDRVAIHCNFVDDQDPSAHDDSMLAANQRIWGFESNFGGLADREPAVLGRDPEVERVEIGSTEQSVTTCANYGGKRSFCIHCGGDTY